MVRGIPKNLNPQSAEVAIERILKRTCKENLLRVVVVGENSYVHPLGLSWTETQTKMKHAEEIQELLEQETCCNKNNKLYETYDS